MYRIAHFSDLHLSAVDSHFGSTLNLIDDAIENEVDHIVISGDLVNSQEMDVLQSFMRRLAQRGWTSAEKLTIVPGNHDFYPDHRHFSGEWKSILELGFTHPQKVYERFNRHVKKTCTGKRSDTFFDGCLFPFGKKLAPHVVLVGFDTTRNGVRYPLLWATGEIQKEDVNEARSFFRQHRTAKHKIVVIHHRPYNTVFHGEFVGPVDGNFVAPNKATARRWLLGTGATLVLCGHDHKTETKLMGENCRMVCSGETGEKGVYHLIDLPEKGKAKVTRR